KVDLRPRQAVDSLVAHYHAREQVRVDLLVLDARVTGRDAPPEEPGQQPGRIPRELQETDRLTGELVTGGTAADDVPHPAPLDEQYLLLPGGRDARIEEKAIGVRGADQAGDECRGTEHVGVHHEDRPVEGVPRRPQREDRALAVAGVGDDTEAKPGRRRVGGGTGRGLPEPPDGGR